ncbi:MAG TPA: lipid biosynthesis B12-binding/radical SAM protein [Candidatus Acidoferrum sp.]|nr:lipid biosynthesis B12-binding/radical SAM protein [Candidatus Acidoferrum sp.]
MRVFLVSVNRESAPYTVAPLGIAYIAGAARTAGHQVELLDLCFSRNIEGDIHRALRRFSPELIGISIRNVDNLTFPASISYLDEIQTAVAALKQASRAPIVAGGPGFSIFPQSLLSLLGLHFGIIGEGEETFCLLAQHLASGTPVPNLPNLIRSGDVACSLERKAVRFVGNGLPARDFLDNARYLELGGMANLQTKRGCPFRCAYCTYPHINGSSLRLRPPSDVVDELASMVVRFGLEQVFFVDDIFNWPADHAMGVCEEIVARGLRVEWACFATPLGMTPELAKAMKRAGCRGVEFGADAATPSMLRELGKPFAQEEIRLASCACREAELPDAHYLIFGGPGETRETMAETFAFYDDLKPRAVLAFLGIRIYPNTRLHRVAIADGIIAEEDNLLFPRFYISPRVGAEELKMAIGSHAEGRANWIVPGLGIRSDPTLLAALRRNGHRGPLWDLL